MPVVLPVINSASQVKARVFRPWFLWLIPVLMLTGCSEEQGIVLLGPPETDVLIAQHRDDPDFVILDVRTPTEFALDRLDGAVLHMDFRGDAFWDGIEALDRDGVYLVYCQSGGRSAAVTEGMMLRGFSELYEMHGGLTGYRAYKQSLSVD